MLKICYILCGLMCPIIYGGFVDFTKSKPIICYFHGNRTELPNNAIPILDPHCVPHQCEIIAFNAFSITVTSEIKCSADNLKIVVSSNIPVLLVVYRDPDIYGWSDILDCDGNPADAKVITDFALENGAKGLILFGIFENEVDSTTSTAITNSAIHYINNLKCNNDLVVGVELSPNEYALKTYDFELVNDVADFFFINTYERNMCDGDFLNGVTPTHGSGDIIGIDTVVGYVNATKLSLSKIYFVVDLMVHDDTNAIRSYGEVCTEKGEKSKWCVAKTKDCYEKAKYIHDQNFGIVIIFTDLDDINNACKCGPFIILLNMIAGFKGEAQIPCALVDCLTP